ncbi:hypothetical protein TTHERM_00477020 (macronuclear) [Tetrahymena thermophila SB210]|uniref:Uncharacterized protein n=1 Tax=Tetrahymena thermophila (strain SB210) TaxID=312017 RepID=I7M1M2_TETTS|nr:hypothetical protein TTHERM_00477020 [Tetrahymena thermophila SB210]EAR97164.3 hypothetical protein TTHERM_00477020 [Tetrahymena thermophila SB210]|eukprot:XP_001017409.3 hypothetical protein TTHERM_00477020 [Tetrahymena thermophila SB210]
MSQFEQELLNFSREFQQQLQQTEQLVFQSLSGVEQRCLSDSRDDVERFVTCMNKATDKISSEEKKFEFRMAFLQNETYNCFKANNNSGKYDICKQNAKSNVKRYLDDFIREIQN